MLAFGIGGLLIGSAPKVATAAKKDCDQGSTGGLTLAPKDCVPFKKARLVGDKAIAPASAPKRVKQVIAAANRIRHLPYNYGGGRGTWPKIDRTGYDCSGSVSFALKGGNFVSSAMPSGGYFNWGKEGKGKWITIYTDDHHMYMIVAGLRFDTSMTPGSGPGWSTSLRSTKGNYKVRSPKGF